MYLEIIEYQFVQIRYPTLEQREQICISDASIGRVDYHHHKSLVKALSVSFCLFVTRGRKMLVKDWDVPRIIFVELKRTYSAWKRLGCVCR